jgi:riboflavin-specific deaminase-like protein
MVTADGRLPDGARAWALLLALARRASEGRPVVSDVGLSLDERGRLVEGGSSWIEARPGSRSGWSPAGGRAALAVGAEVETLLHLYMPLCVGDPAGALVVGHLAQSLDGRIATVAGRSQFIGSQENLVHAHRLRALCDVLLVGRNTIIEDDPQLNTRLVGGPSPVRAVIDPERRLGTHHRVFSDGQRPTLLFCTPDAARGETHHGQAELVPVEPADGILPVASIVAELHRRGLRRLFVEGGGITVSRFLAARALTRLQVTVAPMVLGSGRPTLSLPEIRELSEALPLECRHFSMGRDLLFDCVLAPVAGQK